MSFSLKLVTGGYDETIRHIISQSSFSWAFLWNWFLRPQPEGRSPRLSILFFMSFSLKQKYENSYLELVEIYTLNPLFHELFSETIVYFVAGLVNDYYSQSSFSWAFLWNSASLPFSARGKYASLNPLFHELFSETLVDLALLMLPCSLALNPLFHELFSETIRLTSTLFLHVRYTLNPLFHELFSETK